MFDWFDGPLPLSLLVFGHFILWTGIFNRMHGVAIPRPLMKLSEKTIMLLTVVVCGFAAWSWHVGRPFPRLFPGSVLPTLVAVYGWFCVLMATVTPPIWLWRRIQQRTPAVLRSNHSRELNIADQLGNAPTGDFSTRLLAAFPGNQIFRLHIHEKELAVPRLPTALDGLTIAHLTDLHFSGQITRDFFDIVVDQTNELAADLLLLTGDIVDKQPCLDWIAPTLGRLTAREGKYFILGNHDKRILDTASLRRMIADAGLTDVGGRWLETTLRDTAVAMAGNESPWFARPACPEWNETSPFRILLSHSPDQYHWARDNQFDLMLAGHTHGGQIRFPWVGPLVTASWYGIRYVSGVFHEPPTVMHVSRGISGIQPIRLNCPPELTRITLRCGPGNNR